MQLIGMRRPKTFSDWAVSSHRLGSDWAVSSHRLGLRLNQKEEQFLCAGIKGLCHEAQQGLLSYLFLVAYISVCLYVWIPVPVETRRGQWILGSWSYRKL